jgi:hypothetical protein
MNVLAPDALETNFADRLRLELGGKGVTLHRTA